ncbi:PREDICTED: cytochrome P450 306a1 isoform X1 [Dinoponera quadriceps]|uniref:Cytochrome P450 306a1 isoform X1 n=2 Tax=Dinoponera quadriceps TaxID=609295 RepID=A0A6P3XPR1_DINQU|nr:PREDICTED: cytochrome P450 306a1 isoform X1 [Dinoponera quadriceps]XP_014480495.1 PREDICTED: cytochrome P450 306a1 isoform X1 [Dinoponera quadriceps]XP_014480496.1 PREDICTED: cytochrome P450 306a1 isoform X1 [Dinoponera quadriceps]XP_014480497.1 PREDICTED: cytochrome P450 306a1 isoform X1 [Dinoponera quadriceps]XP_014480498.1 PREDICTED: cytochrome P450 306a1 isoform X1 [Dinoponera quadriceps]XP_014480499.1 PREDICTED: cytochrome P450 306a1 isoform X1 [Dinoponera quadriceps]
MTSLIYVTLGISCFLIFIYTLRKNRKTFRLPPGPLGIPLLGYLPWLDPKNPHVSLTSLARKYGPLCGLRMGSVYTILLSDPRLIRQAFAKDAFAGRAPLYLTHGMMQGYGLICAEGDLWKDQRRFVAGCLKNLGMVKFGTRRDKMEERILATVNECISKLRSRATVDGIDPLETLHHCMGNLMNDLVFGKVYQEDDEVWRWLRHLQEEGVKHIGVAGPLNFLPFLRFLPRYGKVMESLIDGKLKSHRLYETIIDEHRARREKVDSFLAAFDEEMRNRTDAGNAGYFTRPQFYHLLADLFGAGVDTTLTTLRWLLLFVAVHPDEQKKIQDEMSELLGQRQPGLTDRPALIRLEAAISEIQRLRSVTPVGIPHGTTQDTQIGDYDVPKGTMVIPLQWAIHTDPSYWHEPLRFKPERFIAQDGSIARPEAFLPFQAGKRMCVGDELARMILYLFAAKILRSFVISAPSDACIDLDGECGITLVPKPHRLVFTSRE